MAPTVDADLRADHSEPPGWVRSPLASPEVKTDLFGRDGAAHLAAPTGHERFFRRSVVAARVLSVLTSGVEVPDVVELPTDRPLIFAANHSSLFDLNASLISLGYFGLTARIGVNARFFSNPAAALFFTRLGCIPFSREHSGTAEEEMVDALQAGQVCALMPEGRIVRAHERTDGVGPGRTGISRIARRAGAAIVPVGFTGSDRAWPPGTVLARIGFRRPPISAAFGPPMLFATDDHRSNVDDLMSAISRCLRPR
ncbi:MAG: 1-acyl-sn-glycerol-3-phosphate acyltransferase [Acidimicrobiia bacterium]|nr:1-acyl-sn-glycerol-3-phosphate acyltransferase [Acidimicrobiia bacterium]